MRHSKSTNSIVLDLNSKWKFTLKYIQRSVRNPFNNLDTALFRLLQTLNFLWSNSLVLLFPSTNEIVLHVSLFDYNDRILQGSIYPKALRKIGILYI